MSLFFQNKDSEFCYPLDYFIRNAETGQTEMTLYTAKPYKVEGMFFCSHFDLPTENWQCGKACEGYAPKNKAKGLCWNKSTFFYEADKKVTLTITKPY